MSEPIPESIPTSQDPRSKRPTKRRALTPLSEQAQEIKTLFKDPSKEIRLPEPSKPKTLAPPPEIIANVQGSSAGAGSGEFHVYKASRRREYERIKLMEEELKKEKDDIEFNKAREEAKRKDEEKTEKNRRKREKRKKGKGKKGKSGGDDDGGGNDATDAAVKGRATNGDATVSGTKEDGHDNGEVPGVIIHDED
ncbi:TPA_exp: Uncharacterized protein A8136_2848 [Trichophyton benhamiae CBS 112371]|uniref:DUF1168 domain protein n=1 Tax=Arthroderma benhamiae (strain ATCC MYA-4681 / CBS 112371) TaxID=663331 RepID=D4ALK2_ARTBC|nr:uncharacterized protein ARB_05200 [Trichophyton benhamiae CBS 112371]EFE36261.1 hypothetical protein ARB_05200 [Trichophyton benhamiae CBS 112371]DAA79063.1 TPA_exp: Uncharacterized protein A8136_2848 [Trichophyton benhamiae CBS 112371]